jgi:hypothetical protein
MLMILLLILIDANRNVARLGDTNDEIQMSNDEVRFAWGAVAAATR